MNFCRPCAIEDVNNHVQQRQKIIRLLELHPQCCDGKEVAVGTDRGLKDFITPFVKTKVVAEVIGGFESGVECLVDVEHQKVVVVALELGLFDYGAQGSALRPNAETVVKLVRAIDVNEKTQELSLMLLAIVIELEGKSEGEGIRTVTRAARCQVEVGGSTLF